MASDDIDWSWMGVLAPIFAEGHYLTFLNLNPPADAAVKAMRAIVTAGPPRLEDDVAAALDPTLGGWRPQLVAVAAMLAGAVTPATLAALWRGLEQPSWVSPQMAVAASLLDPDFEARARLRIEALCRVDTSAIRRKRDMTDFPDFNDGKQLQALAALLDRNGAPDWLADAKADPAVQEVMASSRDDGGHHALHWLDRVRDVMRAPV